jgi:1-acyl-sn-glycerol-3-phosphate acyltransferase
VRRLWRTLLLLIHLLAGLAMAAAVGVAGNRRLRPEPLAAWWHRRLLRILGIRVRIIGRPAAGSRLLVCNHVSWLDIPVIGGFEHTRFISKAEVRNWPLAGWLAAASATYFLKRGAGGTRELIATLGHDLRAGCITLFPEGTTTEGDRVLRFAPRLFAAAIEAERPIQPLCLRYGRTTGGENIAPFVGDDALTSHLWRLLREPRLEVELIYLPPLPAGEDRGALAATAQAAVEAALVGPSHFGRGQQRRSLAA